MRRMESIIIHLCRELGCPDKPYCKQYCKKHYVSNKPKQKCEEIDCNHVMFRRGKCQKHYRGLPKKKRCQYPECKKLKIYSQERMLCKLHFDKG